MTVYIGLSFGQRVVTFVLIPFLTAVLTPTEYGQIATLTALAALLTILFGLGLETAVFRAQALTGNDAGLRPEGQAVSAYLRVVVPLGGLMFAGLCWLLGLTIGGAPDWALASAIASAALSTPISAHTLPVLRAQERLPPFVIQSTTAISTQVILTVGLVVIADLGLAGWALAGVIGSSVTFAVSFSVVPLGRLADATWRAMKAPLGFTLPLLPHQVMNWLTAFVDRLLMIGFLTAALTGIYSLSYQASIVLGLVLLELNRALMPRYVRLGHERTSPGVLRELVDVHVAAMIVLTALAIVAIPIVTPILFRGQFSSAALYLGPLFLGQLLYGLYFVPANLMTLTRGRSQRMWLASGSAAIVNVGLNLALLRSLGIWGAVVATVGAYAAMAAVAVTLERRVGADLWTAVTGRRMLAAFLAALAMTGAAITPLFGSLSIVAVSYAACLVVVGGGPGLFLWRRRHPIAPHGSHSRPGG